MDILRDYKAIQHFIKGIFSKSEKEYELTFVQDPDDRWYIDMPWTGSRDNLEMVCGADDMLTHLARGDKKVKIHVIVDSLDNPRGFIRLDRYKYSLAGGAHYNIIGSDCRKKTLWICPVTLCVLGRYPEKNLLPSNRVKSIYLFVILDV